MSDEVNKNPVPRIVKGIGFYTPMDIAPGETLPAHTPTTPTSVRGSMGLPTSMGTPPADAPSASAEPAQTGKGDGNGKAS